MKISPAWGPARMLRLSRAAGTARRALAASVTAAGLLAATAPAQAADVGVSIGISQPGVYGRIDIGRFPQPQLIMQQPVVIYRPYQQVVEPVYLWVPPGHQKNWRKHCGRYNACGVPVYFVQERWYRDNGPGREYYQGRRDERRDERGEDRADDHGHGKDKGKGKGHGKGHD